MSYKFIITILQQEDIRSVYSQCHEVQCKQSNSHTSLTSLCSYFSQNTPEGYTKFFFPYKEVSGRNGDHE